MPTSIVSCDPTFMNFFGENYSNYKAPNWKWAHLIIHNVGEKGSLLMFLAHYQFASFLQFQCTFFYFNLLGFTYLLIMKQFHHRHQTQAQIEVDTRIHNPFPSILEKPIYIYIAHISFLHVQEYIVYYRNDYW